MNRAIRRIALQHQAATSLRIVRIVLDHNGRCNPGDDVANLYIVRCQLLGSVERDSSSAAPRPRSAGAPGACGPPGSRARTCRSSRAAPGSNKPIFR